MLDYKRAIIIYVSRMDPEKDSMFLRRIYTIISRYVARRGRD